MTQREEADNNFTKQESSTSDNNNAKNFNPSSSTTTSTTTTTSWSRLKDPRIVRVSRAFGGKDRHSKVCTVRGLRDRRVRLSVPTAIQLYDLQDRLGLNQPSKVVDWLLNAAKHEIDELPPLQIPQGCNFNPILLHETRAESHDHQSKSKYERKVEENQDGFENFQGSRQNPSSLMNSSSSIQYNPFVRWDASSLTLSHPPRSHGLMSSPHQQQQPEDWHNFGLVPSSSNHQVVVYQPAAGLMSAHQSYSFPAQIGGSNAEFDSKQLSFHHQISSPQLSSPVDHSNSTSQGVRPIYFNMTANLLPSQNNGETS